MRDDRAALSRVIRRLAPDVACVQEAPRFAYWLRNRRRLARETGLGLAVGRRPAGLEVYAGARAALLHREHRLLSPVPGLHRRGLALAVVEIGGTRVIAATVHLDLVAGPRLRHAAEIVAALDRARRRFGVPVVVSGDLNEEPGGATWDLFAERFQDAYAVAPRGGRATYSAVAPRTRIDGIFVDREIEVLGCGVPEDQELLADYPCASDHRPLLAELRV